jgi:hypothetical protein
MWGNIWGGHPGSKNYEILLDLLLLQHNQVEVKNAIPVLVFGADNLKRLQDRGITCTLIDNRCSVFPSELTYLHKVLAWDVATGIWDESIYLDVDCQQLIPLPSVFWDIHANKSEIQAPLISHPKRLVPWRQRDGSHRMEPCGCYVYLRGNEIVKNILKIIDKFRVSGMTSFDDEMVLAMLTDKMSGEWKGVSEYNKKYEPNFYHTGRIAQLPVTDPQYFVHYIRARHVLRKLESLGVKLPKT